MWWIFCVFLTFVDFLGCNYRFKELIEFVQFLLLIRLLTRLLCLCLGNLHRFNCCIHLTRQTIISYTWLGDQKLLTLSSQQAGILNYLVEEWKPVNQTQQCLICEQFKQNTETTTMKKWERKADADLSGTLLSIFHLLSNVLDVLLLFGPFLVLQAKCLILEKKKQVSICIIILQ